MRTFKNLVILTLAVSPVFRALAQVPATPPPCEQSIAASELLNHVKLLSSAEMDGRFPASDGYRKAVAYVTSFLKSNGLEPGFSNGFIQYVPVETNIIQETPVLRLLADGKTRQLVAGTDFTCRGFTGGGTHSGLLAFCGYGLTIPEMNYDDYHGIDVKNRVVVVFKQNPSWASHLKGLNDKLTRHKAQNAADHGAVGILFVSLPNIPNPQKPIGSIMDGEGKYLPEMIQMQISTGVADEMLRPSGMPLSLLQTEIDTYKKPHSLLLSDSVYLNVSVRYEPEKMSENICAKISGTHSGQARSFVVIGAHLDHVGRQGSVLYPGANDNASGCAALLSIAGAMASCPKKPAIDVYFVFSTSEEQGLLGSGFFAENPPAPLKQCIAMLNLDCIGHGDSIQVGGGLSAPELWKTARSIDSAGSRLMISDTWKGGGADAQAFFDAGIPTLYFASKYSYTHLHLPGDTPETINGSLLESISRLVYRTCFTIAAAAEKNQ